MIFDHPKIFDIVIREGSLKWVSVLIHCTQPVVSQAIKKWKMNLILNSFYGEFIDPLLQQKSGGSIEGFRKFYCKPNNLKRLVRKWEWGRKE